MDNPFELLLDKLNTIEYLLRNLQKEDKAAVTLPTIF